MGSLNILEVNTYKSPFSRETFKEMGPQLRASLGMPGIGISLMYSLGPHVTAEESRN